MSRYILRRLAYGVITLWLLSVAIFLAGQVLPGNPGLAILGGNADPAAVQALNERLGYNRPVLTRYWDWLTDIAGGDLGESFVYRQPVSEVLGPAVMNSIRLCGLGLFVVVPLSVIGGLLAALTKNSAFDRWLTIGGMSLMVIPQFVTGLALILLFGIALPILPVSATAPPGAGPLTTIWHLLMPATALAAVLFGYIARIVRAGGIRAIEADYTRTAFVKGLRKVTVVRRHVLRNAIPPTITVVATQVGYMLGGLVVIERLFNYPGLGLLILQAAQRKDFPLLQASVLVIGVTYVVVTLVADLIHLGLDPRVRAEEVRV